MFIIKVRCVLCEFLYIRGGQLDKLPEPHFRRQIMQQPCNDKINDPFHTLWFLISSSPDWFQSAVGRLSSEVLLRRRSRRPRVQVNYLSIMFTGDLRELRHSYARPQTALQLRCGHPSYMWCTIILVFKCGDFWYAKWQWGGFSIREIRLSPLTVIPPMILFARRSFRNGKAWHRRVHLALLIRHATRMCRNVCGVSDSKFFDIISWTARFSEKSYWTQNVCFDFL